RGRLVFSGTVEALGNHMSGSAPIRLRLLSDDDSVTADAERLLMQQPGVTGISRDEPTVLSVSFDGDDSRTADVLKALMERGLPVAEFYRPPVNLEKVFMEVTQND
ncbi:MAG: hypothetical protein FWF86_07995, partial [Clostridia bacterium]|nr:hypothetical protein [Clostridia bacterium]